MAVPQSDAEVADRLSRRRARTLPVLAVFFIIQQSAYWSNPPGERLVDHVRLGAWAMMRWSFCSPWEPAGSGVASPRSGRWSMTSRPAPTAAPR